MKLRDFKREGFIFVKNAGVQNVGRALCGIGIGTLSFVGLTHIVPSWKIQGEFGEKYMKICSIVGVTAAMGGTLMGDLSIHRYGITANKGAYRDSYQSILDKLPED